MQLRLLYQDQDLVVVDKPAGFHVHPPEDKRHRISDQLNSMRILRDQLGQLVYPVHRLDRATSGALIFALNSSTAAKLCESFQSGSIKKTYYCVTRGWTDDSGLIDHPLESDSRPGIRLQCQTRYKTLARMELPYPTRRYPSSRYSLVRAEPLTGRMHQIRRHFAHVSHPLIGDTVYGDGEHNRLFRERLGIQQLLLKAQVLDFDHPVTGKTVRVVSRWGGSWHKLFVLFGVCPI